MILEGKANIRRGLGTAIHNTLALRPALISPYGNQIKLKLPGDDDGLKLDSLNTTFSSAKGIICVLLTLLALKWSDSSFREPVIDRFNGQTGNPSQSVESDQFNIKLPTRTPELPTKTPAPTKTSIQPSATPIGTPISDNNTRVTTTVQDDCAHLNDKSPGAVDRLCTLDKIGGIAVVAAFAALIGGAIFLLTSHK